jgi:hypothetical protein
MVEAIIYVVFCILTGLCGIDRRMGFFGTFVIALITTRWWYCLYCCSPARLAASSGIAKRRASVD